jgi:hypothetical protein
MSLQFDEVYFNGGNGYGNYRGYTHFQERANWLNDFMIANGYSTILILGAGYGYLIKALVENHGFTSATVKGIENSNYALAQAELLGYGVSQGYMINADIRTYSLPQTDLVVSWNVLDSLTNLTEIQQIINQINNINCASIHVYCGSIDPLNSHYNDLGYFIPSFFDVFQAMEMNPQDDPSYLIRYHDGYTYRIIRQGGSKFGTPYTGLNIPTCWGRVSD